jgi:L-asparagine transporter-like permease
VFGWIGPVGVLAMNSVHHGWFFNNKEWIEYIVAVVVLWLLAMTAVSVFDLRSAG